MMVGTGYTSREFFDGESLASPGRWPVAMRRYPSNSHWSRVASFYLNHGSVRLFMELALGSVPSCPFSDESITDLKNQVILELEQAGLGDRTSSDRVEVRIDNRYVDLLLRAAEDPKVGSGGFSRSVRAGPGARLPRLPSLYKPKRKWRLPEQANSAAYLNGTQEGDAIWRRNDSTIDDLEDKVVEVLDDQAASGQIIKLSEPEARASFPGPVVASFGANRKDKPNGVVTARVLFDGTHGISVNNRTTIRDQERTPVASDLKRAMREGGRWA